ncbi:MAG: hypothetical protein R3217_09240 [Gammaproteobacteria bacterium]|nr:hypothetical protein [Gammaproteobacteria bacterium]
MSSRHQRFFDAVYRELLLMALAVSYLFAVLESYRAVSRNLPDDLWLAVGNPLVTLALVRLLVTGIVAVLVSLLALLLLRRWRLSLHGEELFRLGIVAGTLLLLVETRWQESVYPGWTTLLRALLVAAAPLLLGHCLRRRPVDAA